MNKSLILSGVLFLALIVGGIVYWCTAGYGKVSPDAYEVAKALYGTCLSESDQRLEMVSSLLDDDEDSLEVTARERDWLESMIEKAKDGNWKSAAKSARRMMEDQVAH